MIVKICGLTNAREAGACAALGADMIGLNFWPESRRFVELERASEVAAAARAENPAIVVVGVFVNAAQDAIARAEEAAGLDRIQLHGDEPAAVVDIYGERAIRALRLRQARDLKAAEGLRCTLLVDAAAPGYGGTGHRADWSLAAELVKAGREVLLAGGLDPGNVAAAIAAVRPHGVDVASGVEASPGRKDLDKVRAFLRAARESA